MLSLIMSILLGTTAIITGIMRARGIFLNYISGNNLGDENDESRDQEVGNAYTTSDRKTQILDKVGAATPWALGALALALFFPLHFVAPGGSQVVLKDSIYLGGSLGNGRLIATNGERGLQAEILMPGFQFDPFVNVFYRTEIVDYVSIPEGSYGLVFAKDGQPLGEGEVIAPPVPPTLFIDPTGFLEGKDGAKGTKGMQSTILRPGKYPINLHLFDVDTINTKATIVPNGQVAVIKSAVNEGRRPDFMPSAAGAPVDCGIVEETKVGTVEVELVKPGCRGTWDEALPPGVYFLNREAYDVTLQETRTNVWTYRGGYQTSQVDLEIANDGSVKQSKRQITVPTSSEAEGNAIAVKVEGWTVYVDVRVQAQVSPNQAPATVAAVGGMDNVRDRFITPDLRSALRNIGGGKIRVPNRVAYEQSVARLEALRTKVELLRQPSADRDQSLSEADMNAEIARLTADIKKAEDELPNPDETVERQTLVLDFIENREILENLVFEAMQDAGRDAGITIVGVKFGNIDIPPGLLVARKREQLAQQFAQATVQERLAQRERIATEKERATAEEQPNLVRAQIGVQTSELAIRQKQNEGEAERKFLEALAAGEKARVDVIGQQNVFTLRLAEALLAAVQKDPTILGNIKLPSTLLINGATSGNDLTNAAAVLSGTKFFGGPKTEENR